MKNKIILAFDLGGSSIKYTVDGLQTILNQTFTRINKQQVLQFIGKVANQHHADEICLSAPGIIDSQTGRIWGYSAIEDWASDNIFAELKQLLTNQNIKIYIDNDGNCALLGCVHDVNQEVHSALSIVIGTGIGAAYYCDHKINKGFNNAMGELGMMYSDFTSEHNISTVLSTNALCNGVNQALNTKYNGQEIFDRFTLDEHIIIPFVELWIQKNAKFIYNMIWAFDPQYLFIGGAIAENTTFRCLLCAAVDTTFKKIEMQNKTQLVFAQGGNRLNLLGALLLSKSF